MKIVVKNRKASYEYTFEEKYTAGIKLVGTEVKSIRNNDVSIKEAYCFFKDNELYLKGMHVAEYKQGSHTNHEPTRDRKLLLNRKELNKLESEVQKKGLTVVPVSLIINDKGLIKLEIALAKGKKLYDKRNTIKERDQKRDIDREKINR